MRQDNTQLLLNNMKFSKKIIIGIFCCALIFFLLCIIFWTCSSEKQIKKQEYKINEKYTEKSNKAGIAFLNDFVAIETASYPCSSTQSSMYCGNVMKFVEDYTRRRNIVFTKSDNDYTLHLPKTQDSNIDQTITIFVNLENYKGNNYGDGIIVDDDSKLVKGDQNYNLCSRGNLGIAIVLSLALGNQFVHGPLDVIIGNKMPSNSNKIIELGATDKLTKVICRSQSSFDIVDKVYQDTLGSNTERIESSKVSDNYFGLGFDIDDVGTVNEVLHSDCLSAYAAVLQGLLNI